MARLPMSALLHAVDTDRAKIGWGIPKAAFGWQMLEAVKGMLLLLLFETVALRLLEWLSEAVARIIG